MASLRGSVLIDVGVMQALPDGEGGNDITVDEHALDCARGERREFEVLRKIGADLGLGVLWVYMKSTFHPGPDLSL